MEWISQLPAHLSHTFGAAQLSEQDVSKIQQLVLTPHNVTVQSFINQYHQLYPSQVYLRKDFILEALLVSKGIGSEEIECIMSYLSKLLEIPNEKWSWGIPDPKICIKFYYPLRVVRKLIELESLSNSVKSQLLTLASFHAFPNSPWSSQINSELLVTPIKARLTDLDDAIIDMISIIRPKLLTVSKSNTQQISLQNSKLTPAGYSSGKSGSHRGLKPKLGYSHIAESSNEESSRRDWKLSNNVATISLTWLLIQLVQGKWFESYWAVTTSFILNLIDDYEVRYKALAAELLGLLTHNLDQLNDPKGNLLLRTGLVEVFLDSLKVCLSYLPESTPVDDSRIILTAAYPTTFNLAHILSELKGNRLVFFDLINGYILSSIDTCFDRYGNSSKHLILLLLLGTLNDVIASYIHEDILISLNRCNFVLNQIIVNPHLVESATGLDCIDECLKIQATVLQVFENADDKGKELLLSFKFDFLAAWSVYVKRLIKLHKAVPSDLVKNNIRLLSTIAGTREALEQIVTQNTELQEYLV